MDDDEEQNPKPKKKSKTETKDGQPAAEIKQLITEAFKIKLQYQSVKNWRRCSPQEHSERR